MLRIVLPTLDAPPPWDGNYLYVGDFAAGEDRHKVHRRRVRSILQRNGITDQASRNHVTMTMIAQNSSREQFYTIVSSVFSVLLQLVERIEFTHYNLAPDNVLVSRHGISFRNLGLSYFRVDNQKHGVKVGNWVEARCCWPVDIHRLLLGCYYCGNQAVSNLCMEMMSDIFDFSVFTPDVETQGGVFSMELTEQIALSPHCIMMEKDAYLSSNWITCAPNTEKFLAYLTRKMQELSPPVEREAQHPVDQLAGHC